ncbi:MAG: FtsQ-type POTRA domain-containing protein [Desulfatitalea sp.]|nr:FtsQ-type POTRA domain-containing protein [Desulfatitalea sp.]NNK01304.1 FtsQ-type POTRA domain-containing protein [Desulfatitalea sp.]
MHLDKNKKKVRKNRFKKSSQPTPRRWLNRLRIGFRLTTLLVVLSAISALCMAGYTAVTRSAYFRTQTINVHCGKRLSHKEILTQAGIQSGDNLMAVNLRLARKRLLAHPWIATARVSRQIPNTIDIQVREHIPLARVDLGRIFLINLQGRIFKELEETDPLDLPLVNGVTYADISLGNDTLSTPLAAVMKVLRMSREPGAAISFSQIDCLYLDREMGVVLTLKQKKRQIKLGYDDYEAKYKRYSQLRRHLEHNRRWQNYKTVDLKDPDRVVVEIG